MPDSRPDQNSRLRMVERQIRGRGITDRHVLDAMRETPREAFVAEGFEKYAHEDSALPIAEGQTISQPYIVARMIAAAEPRPDDVALEVGAGSGYAAAVLGRIVSRVDAIERHGTLARSARAAIEETGPQTVTIHHGDGTRGLPDRAPFDVILVSAGGEEVPRPLLEQLAPGGRLIIPIGKLGGAQQLVKIVRTGELEFEKEHLDMVRFVPLIGDTAPTHRSTDSALEARTESRPSDTISAIVAKAAEPLPEVSDDAFGEAFDRFGDKRLVLLGEASHGTQDFYEARAAITRRLVEEHGFRMIALEADWPDAARLNRYIRHRKSGSQTEPPFQRFPRWMWRNTVFSELIAWLRDFNSQAGRNDPAGVYGLDIYNLAGSMNRVVDYLETVDPEAASVARSRYGCLEPFQSDPSAYGRAVLTERYRSCAPQVVAQCRDLLEQDINASISDGDDLLDAREASRIASRAEEYYRIMYYGGAEAWNLRDQSMFETLSNLMEHGDGRSKAVVWAHNSHVGDARETDMGRIRGEHNLGQLCREAFGDEVALIGFGTHGGKVAAASDWGGEMEVKTVRPSHPESAERLFHEAGETRALFDFRRNATLAEALSDPRLQRFIGVIYRPQTEVASHYAEASLSRQYDAWVWFDETSALTPLPVADAKAKPADTWPFGL